MGSPVLLVRSERYDSEPVHSEHLRHVAAQVQLVLIAGAGENSLQAFAQYLKAIAQRLL